MLLTYLLYCGWCEGNSDGAVTSGPAARWPVSPAECTRMFRTRTLTRRMRRNAARSFFSHADVTHNHLLWFHAPLDSKWGQWRSQGGSGGTPQTGFTKKFLAVLLSR